MPNEGSPILPTRQTPLDYAAARERQNIAEQTARLRERFHELDEALQDAPPEPEHIRKINEIIAHGRYLAERNPLFSAARSVAVHRPVLPLEAGGTTPMVPINEANQDLATLIDWWVQWPEANVGCLAGHFGRLIAVRIGGSPEALEAWRALATISYRDPDSDRVYSELQPMEAAVVTVGEQPPPVRVRNVRLPWGKKAQAQALQDILKGQRPKIIVSYLLWSFPTLESGQDLYDYPRKQLASGVDLLGEGDVIPAGGHLLDGTAIHTPGIGWLPEVPAWFARRYGKARKV
jgi:hypothetical protein